MNPEIFIKMLFNPALPLGAPIKGVFRGWKVDFPVDRMASLPFEVAKELLNRYPWLSPVEDHPQNKGKLPFPPSVVEGWTPEQVLYPDKIKEEISKESIPDLEQDIFEGYICEVCDRRLRTGQGLALHRKRVHKLPYGIPSRS